MVPAQITEYAVKVLLPVPPPATGNPVQLVNVPDVGVPKTGVTNVGEVVPAKEPVPLEPDKPTLT